MSSKYKSFLVTEKHTGSFTREIVERDLSDLPNHDTLIEVNYSSLNYKDALSINGHKGITKHYPHQPGIDATGTVINSNGNHFKAGDEVIVTGYDLGMNTAGGFGKRICVPHEWVIPLPVGLTQKTAMMYGTAGFTAALGLYLLERNGQKPDQGDVVVTGATGGVGSMAVSILNKAGYSVVASTGKKDTAHHFLKQLGARKVVDRHYVDIDTEKSLLRTTWAGAIDTVGGNTLHTLLKACKPYGNVACCGLVQSAELNCTVYPFIINGVSLLGIATAENPIDMKRLIWNKLANEWSVPLLEEISTTITLEELSDTVDLMMAGETKGRIIVDLA